MKTKNVRYVAEFSYGKPRLVEVEVVKETEKTITKGKETKLLGWGVYVPDRISKANYNIYDNLPDALAYLHTRAVEHLESMREALLKADKNVTMLTQVVDKLAAAEKPQQELKS